MGSQTIIPYVRYITYPNTFHIARPTTATATAKFQSRAPYALRGRGSSGSLTASLLPHPDPSLKCPRPCSPFREGLRPGPASHDACPTIAVCTPNPSWPRAAGGGG